MSKTSKLAPIVIGGVGVASGALLAAWLLTGTRKEKTRRIISKGRDTLKQSLKKRHDVFDDSEVYYI